MKDLQAINKEDVNEKTNEVEQVLETVHAKDKEEVLASAEIMQELEQSAETPAEDQKEPEIVTTGEVNSIDSTEMIVEDETEVKEPVEAVDDKAEVQTETKDEVVAAPVVEESAPVEEAKDEAVMEKEVALKAEKPEEIPVVETIAPVPDSKEKDKEVISEKTPAAEKLDTEVNIDIDESDEDIEEDDIDNYLEDDEEQDGAEKRVDYSTFSKEELVTLLADKLENAPIQDIKYDVDSIKSNFYKKHKLEVDQAKKAFIAEGGDPATFVPEADENEEKLKILVNEYKRLKAEFNKSIELEKEANLKKKYEIIEEIKELINGKESINKTFNDFRELQNKWRGIGLVPQSEVKNLWENYHHNIEQFYDYIKINRELRDLDLKKNLESKVKLCEAAEELMLEPSVVKAFKQLQKLHEQWRDIGPVPEENREDIWERFKSSTTNINKAHQDYFEELKQDQTNNLNAKIALCEKAEEIANSENLKHKDWENKSDELIEVQKLWKTIGFATKKENNKIFERFREACDLFFTKKRDFYYEHREVQNNNLQLKTELCMQAEAIKDSNDWKKTANELIRLQKDWKEIGPVPRKQSDIIWKRFRAACNEFFERKTKYFANIDQEFEGNLKAKQELIEKVKTFEQKENIEENINLLKGFQNEWTEIGHVPFKIKEKIQKEFRDAVNEQFDKLKIDSDKRNVLVYKQRLESISQGDRPARLYRVEKDRILETIRTLESDIVLLENNIGFFAKTKNAEALIKDVNSKIEKAKRRIKTEKQKLDLINKFE